MAGNFLRIKKRKPRKKKPKAATKRVPRAIVSAKYATIYEGKRLVRPYYSGEPLQGSLEH